MNSEAYMTSPIGDLPINSDGLRKAVDEIDRMQSALSESQRRERAAVEDLTKLARKPITPCYSCSKSCVAPASLAKEYEIKWCKDWEWRGPQEAGKEDNP